MPDIEAKLNAAESLRLADIPHSAMFESLSSTSTTSLDAYKEGEKFCPVRKQRPRVPPRA